MAMKRATSILAAIAVLSISTGAYAQTAPPPPADPAKLALARDVFEANGGRQQIEATMKAIFGGVSKMFDGLPASQANVAMLAQRDMQDEIVKMIPAILDLTADVYARNLSEKELRDMLAWTKSESAQSIKAKTPLMTQQMVAAELPLIKAMMPNVMHKTVDRACDEAKCTADQKQQMAEIVDKAISTTLR
jgi:hypothetical protein